MSYSTLDLAVLKNIITNKKHGIDFVNDNDAKIFSPDVWNFANIVVNYIRTYKELPTLRVLSERLEKGNNGKLIENIKNVWQELDKIAVNDHEYKHDLEKIKNRFAEKQLINTKEALSNLQLGSIDINKSVSDLQKTIQSIKGLDRNRSHDSKNIKDFLPKFVEQFNAKKNNPTLDKGLMTGYSFFDFATNGLKSADFVVIAGESGFGKSLFLNNIAIQVWLQNNKILLHSDDPVQNVKALTGGKDIIYFSLEMPYEDCFNRLLSRLSGVPSRKIENANLNKTEFDLVKKCLDFIRDYPFNFKIVDIADACANDLETILIDSGENFDAIFVDYLGIMNTNEKSAEQDWLKQGIIAYELRHIGRKYSKSMFSAVQLNRKVGGKESSENIGLSRLARSATIATHATHVVQIENRPNEEKYPDFIYHFIKNRKGPKGKGTLIKNLSCAALIDKIDDSMLAANDTELNDMFKDQDDISEEMKDLEL